MVPREGPEDKQRSNANWEMEQSNRKIESYECPYMPSENGQPLLRDQNGPSKPRNRPMGIHSKNR